MSGVTRFPPDLGVQAFQARAFRDEKDLAPERWRRVRTWRRGQRLAIAAELPYASLPFCDLLLDRAFEAAPRSLFEARELASLAAELAAQLTGRGCPPPLARNCRARTALARAYLALAAGEVAEASSFLVLARSLAGEGSGDAQ